jgi:uncharacterized RDD family membrane protein YckC
MGVHYKMIGADGREYAASLDDLQAWIAEGRMAASTWIWSSEEERWQPAHNWPELKWHLPEEPPRLPQRSRNGQEAAAGIPVRIAAFTADFLILGALISLVTMPWADAFNALSESALNESRKAVPDIGVILKFYAAFLLVLIPLRFAYTATFITYLGATPGKLVFGLKVISADGNHMAPPQVTLRCLAEWLSLASLGVGYLLAVMTPQGQTLHDLISATRVVHQSSSIDEVDPSS